MITENRPSVFRIMFTNYVAFIGVLSPALLWLVFLFDHFRGDRLTTSDLIALGSITLLGLIIMVWKIFSISAIINNGLETTATVHSSGFYRSRGRIKFIYSFQGEKYMTQNTVNSNKRTRAFTAGDQVSICLDPNNPKKAIIKDIYSA